MNRNGSIRWVNVALGAWLFISAFAWMHTQAQFTNTWLVGLASGITAAIAMRIPQARYINVLLSLWLLVSVWALPLEMQATFWNNLLTAIVMFIVALTPSMPDRGARLSGQAFRAGSH